MGERETLAWADWVRATGRAAGWGGEVFVVPRERLPVHLVVDSTRIREELGYGEQVSRAEALRRTVAWERALNTPSDQRADR